ncbi:hypothetical protein LSAT2_014380, partial [Lamellibrachia satsuma]
RHDGVNALLSAQLRNRGFTTAIEPAIPTPAGMRYPDIVANKPDVFGHPQTGAVRQPMFLPTMSGSPRASSTGGGRLRREASTNDSP